MGNLTGPFVSLTESICKPPAGAGSSILDLVPNLEDEEGDHPEQSGDLKAPSEEHQIRSNTLIMVIIFFATKMYITPCPLPIAHKFRCSLKIYGTCLRLPW